MLILFFCTYFATSGYKRPCNFETLFHIVARVFSAISAGFNTSVGTAFDNAVSASVFRLTARTGNLLIRHEMIPIPNLHPQLGSVAEFFVCLFIWMCNIPWAGSTIISASRYYLFHYPLPLSLFLLIMKHHRQLIISEFFSSYGSKTMPICPPSPLSYSEHFTPAFSRTSLK